ncbi:MAG: hypothetical protein DBY41_06580 [Clostridium sp.]|jgi:hypothetical protein|nr:MAG: hypothetical protein DBY41_06580 [Clostridium sp.]
MKELWIIGIANSESERVVIQQVLGTVGEVKNHLVKLIKEDKKNDEENYDFGTDDVDDIEEYYVDNNDLNKIYQLEGFATYHEYHINYTATLASENTVIEL